MYRIVFADWRNKIKHIDVNGFVNAVKLARTHKNAVMVTFADGKKRDVKFN